MVIYWDILLAVNLVVNALILYLTAIASGLRVKRWRIWISASLGAIYVVASGIVPELLSPVAKLVLSLLLVWLTFGYRSWRTYLFRCSVFYLISFAIGGAILGWLNWYQTIPLTQRSLTIGQLGGGVIIGAAALFFCLRRTMLNAEQLAYSARVTVKCGNRKDTFCGLIDSGNCLSVYARHAPVIVAEYTAVTSLIATIRPLLDATPQTEWVQAIATSQDTLWQSRLVVLPHRTVSTTNAMLLGIRVDEVSVAAGGRQYHMRDAVVAIVKPVLSPNGTYQAIVPSRLMVEGECMKGEII